MLEPDAASADARIAPSSRGNTGGTAAEAGASEAETGNPLAEVVPGARVLGPTREELAERRAANARRLAQKLADGRIRSSWARSAPSRHMRSCIEARYAGTQPKNSGSPLGPCCDRRQEHRFTHQRVDSRQPTTYTFVRRPAYYATFTTGPSSTAQQRFGLGLLWTPEAGTMIQSQSSGIGTAWGTRADSLVYEAGTITASFASGTQAVSLSPGNRDLPDGVLRASYSLGASGTKVVAFDDAGIHVDVQHVRAFTEQVPLLLLPSDSLERGPGRLVLHRGASALTIRWMPATAAVVTPTEETVTQS